MGSELCLPDRVREQGLHIIQQVQIAQFLAEQFRGHVANRVRDFFDQQFAKAAACTAELFAERFGGQRLPGRRGDSCHESLRVFIVMLDERFEASVKLISLEPLLMVSQSILSVL